MVVQADSATPFVSHASDIGRRDPGRWLIGGLGLMWDNDDQWYYVVMSHTEQVTIGDRGRLVLPASVRAALGLKPGTRMLLSTEDDGSLRLRPYRAVADGSRGLFAGLAEKGSLVDELLAERRAEAEREE